MLNKIKKEFKKRQDDILYLLTMLTYLNTFLLGVLRLYNLLWVVVLHMVLLKLLSLYIVYNNTKKEEAENKTKLPIHNKRFTYIDEDGNISMNSRDITILVKYLFELENYLQNKGFTKW